MKDAKNQVTAPKQYITEDTASVTPYSGFIVSLPKYKGEGVYGVFAHVEYYHRDDGNLDVKVWSVINNTHFRWFVMEFAAELAEEDKKDHESIISALVNYLNECEEFHQGMLNSFESMNHMLDMLAL